MIRKSLIAGALTAIVAFTSVPAFAGSVTIQQ